MDRLSKVLANSSGEDDSRNLQPHRTTVNTPANKRGGRTEEIKRAVCCSHANCVAHLTCTTDTSLGCATETYVFTMAVAMSAVKVCAQNDASRTLSALRRARRNTVLPP